MPPLVADTRVPFGCVDSARAMSNNLPVFAVLLANEPVVLFA